MKKHNTQVKTDKMCSLMQSIPNPDSDGGKMLRAPCPKLARDISKLLSDEGSLFDFTLVCAPGKEGEDESVRSLRCHKAILGARCVAVTRGD